MENNKQYITKTIKGIINLNLFFDSLEYLNRGIKFGGKMISQLKVRDWGDEVGYIADLDGHIIAFAEKTTI